MTKLSDTYRTPLWLFKLLDDQFNFFWDACCDENNCLVKNQFYQLSELGLIGYRPYNYLNTNLLQISNEYHTHYMDKDYSVFMNPPFSDPMPFIKKAWEDSKYFRHVLLVRDDPSTDWYKHLVGNSTLHKNPGTGSEFKIDISDVKEEMENNGHTSAVIHLPKRIKFYASEEILQEDYLNNIDHKDVRCCAPDETDNYISHAITGHLLETKNFIRKEDGIECKNSYNFPIAIIVLDRRHG